MINARENSTHTHQLEPRPYKIGDNVFTAYYDAAGKLVFVLDETISPIKPNVLLVINPVGNRKWDDILSNDYNIDLETIRPKKDNKYQKLDIEYAGLGAYDNLVTAYTAGDDIAATTAALNQFRNASVRRAATDRLAAANETADKARETIERTNATIDDLKSRLKELRSKLTTQRRAVGREPTKQSAAKILRTEAQIESTNDKLRRAMRRLSNAQHRLDAALSDAQMATQLLQTVPADTAPIENYAVATPAPRDVMAGPDPMFQNIDVDDVENDVADNESGDEMTDNDNDAVAPLLSQDPEIMDEKIAFRPIDFDAPAPSDAPEKGAPAPEFSQVPVFETIAPEVIEPAAPAESSDTSDFVPLSFTPPPARTEKRLDEEEPGRPEQEQVPADDAINVTPIIDTPPVLDTIRPLEASTPSLSDDAPAAPSDAQPDIAPAPASDASVRPISPITGMGTPSTTRRGRPTLGYYILLGLLIVLSIFTLWLYQRNVGTTAPDLVAVSGDVTAGMDNDAPVPVAEVAPETDPFITPEVNPVAEFVERGQNASDKTSDTPAPAAEPTPVLAPAAESVDVVAVAPAPTPVEESSAPAQTESAPMADPLEPEAEPEPTFVAVESETTAVVSPAPDEAVVDKPAYNVSQQEKMFVATDDSDVAQLWCDDGTRPDPYGCCTGETYTQMDNGDYACCPSGGGDCFPPIRQ